MIVARTAVVGIIAGALYALSGDLPSRDAQHQADAPLAIVDVTVIPVVTAGTLPRQTVLIRDGRIIAVGPRASVRLPGNARVIDGRGKFLVPGLVDAHVHLEEVADLPQFVAAGVTTVRDLMGSPETLAWRRNTADGTVVGPRVIAAGRCSPALRSPGAGSS
jgi:predicted amidohydrolase YtcJ